ncbi:MAG: Gfo/Idh/MocA family oxidoreductase [Planctomycetota bacterium]
MPKPLRIGLVGFGFGYFHARSIANRTDATLVAVADRNNDSLPVAAEAMGFTVFRDAVEMIRSGTVDALVVATSPSFRKPIVEAAVDVGLPMFVEKPWAGDPESARALAAICDRSTVPVMVGFSFRFHPAIAKLRALDLGGPRMLCGQYVFDWLPDADNWMWSTGGGFLNENSCHLFDAVCALMGRPTRVFAEGGMFEGRPAPDSAAITLRFENDAIAALTVGGIARGGVDFPRIDLHAEKGSATLLGQNHIWRELRYDLGDGEHRHVADPEQLGDTRYSHALSHFFDCVRENKQPDATVADGVLAVDIAHAVTESARTGQPVDIPKGTS